MSKRPPLCDLFERRAEIEKNARKYLKGVDINVVFEVLHHWEHTNRYLRNLAIAYHKIYEECLVRFAEMNYERYFPEGKTDG